MNDEFGMVFVKNTVVVVWHDIVMVAVEGILVVAVEFFMANDVIVVTTFINVVPVVVLCICLIV